MNADDNLIPNKIIMLCEAINFRIEKYSINEASFVSNDEFQDMLLMPVFQIGELANSVSDNLKAEHNEIPWCEIVTFRNIIAHDYGVVDPIWAWNTITIDIPTLKQQIEDIV